MTDEFEFEPETDIPSTADLYPLTCGPAELEALRELDRRLASGDASGHDVTALLAAITDARIAEAAPLPAWAEMDDLDRGAALMYLHKADQDGGDYARANYPCRYLTDPRLVALDVGQACAHADVFLARSLEIDGDEHARLYDLALDEAARRAAPAAGGCSLCGATLTSALLEFGTGIRHVHPASDAAWELRAMPRVGRTR